MKKKLSIIAACAAMLITLGISVFTWTENKSTFLINNSDGIDSQNFTGSDGKCEKNSNTGNNNCKSGSNGAKSKTPGTAAKKDFVITIDPGHGGYDPGKVGVNNIQEKDVNLAISLILRDILTDSGFTVYLTRDSLTYPSAYTKTASPTAVSTVPRCSTIFLLTKAAPWQIALRKVSAPPFHLILPENPRQMITIYSLKTIPAPRLLLSAAS